MLMLTLALCSYHAERGSLQIVLESGCASVPVTGSSAILQARLLHGYSMFIGWSTVVALGGLLRARTRHVSGPTRTHWCDAAWDLVRPGIFIARYCRHKTWWVKAHVTLQSLGTAGTLSAALVAASNTKGHFAHVHSFIGITIAASTGEHRVFAPTPHGMSDSTMHKWCCVRLCVALAVAVIVIVGCVDTPQCCKRLQGSVCTRFAWRIHSTKTHS